MKPFKELKNRFYLPLVMPLAIRKLSRLRAKVTTVEEAVTLAANFAWGRVKGFRVGLGMTQITTEITELAQLVKELKPQVIGEIGTAGGGTLLLWCLLSADDAEVVSIDLPGGDWGGGYPATKIPLLESFLRGQQRLYLLREDSHEAGTRERLVNILGAKKFDFLFIDGDHSYEGVKSDFTFYKDCVKAGGVIAFHDILACHGVYKFWQEVRCSYRHREILSSFNRGTYGIGVAFLP